MNETKDKESEKPKGETTNEELKGLINILI